MEEKGKDIDFNFTPQKGVGKILFSFNEKDVLKILGTPTERSVDVFFDNEYAIYLDYYNSYDSHLSVNLYFENNILDYLSIYTNDIILDNFQFSLYHQDEILSFIKKYHDVHKLDFVEKEEYNKNTKEIFYDYDNIGLAIWFDKSGISGICVQKTT